MLGPLQVGQRIDDFAVQIHVSMAQSNVPLRRRDGVCQPRHGQGGFVADAAQQLMHENAHHHLVFHQKERAGILAA